MIPEKPRPNSAVTVNRPISSCVTAIAAIVQNCQTEPIKIVSSPPMRSEIAPQICRLTKAVPSSTDSIAAPWVGLMPRSLHIATRWTCGIDIGMQQQNAAIASIANTTFGGQPSTVGRAACAEAVTGSRISGGRFRTMIAIGTMTATSKPANISMVCRQPYSPIA